jgi:hypothetical protein
MTSAPKDLLNFRSLVMSATGITNQAEVGIVGDTSHQKTGGYHIGKDGLIAIGRYHPNAQAGASTEDYSCRIGRDRKGLTNNASAMDIGRDWVKGGHGAWLRWNNLVVNALRSGDHRLSTLRAVNYTPDGNQKFRTDREQGFTIVTSGDTVDIHTHFEWYRDTENQRGQCFTALLSMMEQAIGGTDMTPEEHTAVTATWTWLNRVLNLASNDPEVHNLPLIKAILNPPSGGLTEEDRQVMKNLTDAVNALENRLASP